MKMGSQTHSTGGMINMLMTAEIRAPRASIMQMELMISISEIVPTPVSYTHLEVYKRQSSSRVKGMPSVRLMLMKALTSFGKQEPP